LVFWSFDFCNTCFHHTLLFTTHSFKDIKTVQKITINNSNTAIMRANFASIILLSALGGRLTSAQGTPACLTAIIGTAGYVHHQSYLLLTSPHVNIFLLLLVSPSTLAISCPEIYAATGSMSMLGFTPPALPRISLLPSQHLKGFAHLLDVLFVSYTTKIIFKTCLG